MTSRVVQGEVLQGSVVSNPIAASSSAQSDQLLSRALADKDELVRTNQELTRRLEEMRETSNQLALSYEHAQMAAQGGEAASAPSAKNRFLKFVDDVTEKRDWKAEAEALRKHIISSQEASASEVKALQLNVSLVQNRNREVESEVDRLKRQNRDLTAQLNLLNEEEDVQEEDTSAKGFTKSASSDDDDFENLFSDSGEKRQKRTDAIPTPKSVARSSVRAVVAALQTANAERDDAQREAAEAHRKLQNASDEIVARRAQEGDLRQQLHQSNQRGEAAAIEIQRLRSQVEALHQMDRTDATVELEEAMLQERRLRNELQQRCVELAERTSKQDAALHTMKTAMSELELQYERKSLLADTARNWETKCINAKDDLKRALAEHSKVHSQLRELQKQLQLERGMASATAKATIEAQRRALFADVVLAPALKSLSQKAAAVVEERSAESSEKAVLLDQVANLERAVEESKHGSAVELRRLASDNRNLRQTVGDLQTEIIDLQNTIERERSQRALEACPRPMTPPRAAHSHVEASANATPPPKVPPFSEPEQPFSTPTDVEAEQQQQHVLSAPTSAPPPPPLSAPPPPSQTPPPSKAPQGKGDAILGAASGFLNKLRKKEPSKVEVLHSQEMERAQSVLKQALEENFALQKKVRQLSLKLQKYEDL